MTANTALWPRGLLLCHCRRRHCLRPIALAWLGVLARPGATILYHQQVAGRAEARAQRPPVGRVRVIGEHYELRFSCGAVTRAQLGVVESAMAMMRPEEPPQRARQRRT